MSLPGVSLVTVEYGFVDLTAAPVIGRVRFYPAATVTVAGDVIVDGRRPIVGLIDPDTGLGSVELPATDDADLNPTLGHYRVVEPSGATYSIVVPAATVGPLQLVDLRPVGLAPAPLTDASVRIRQAIDYDDTTPPEDGQAIVWDGATSTYLPGDVAASSSGAPATSARPGNRFVMLGDSITAGQWDTASQVQGASWPLYAQMFSAGRIFIARNASVAGNTTAQMLARFDADVAAYNPVTVVITGGTNDVNSAVPLATTTANIEAMVAATREVGAVPVLGTIPPGSTLTGERALLNHWLRRYTAEQGLALIDFYKLLVDPTDGDYLAAYADGDGVHPNAAGYRVMGQLVADSLSPLLPAWSPPLCWDATDELGIFASFNPLFLTDTNVDGVPNDWIAYGGSSGFAHSLVVDAAVAGKMARITQTANADQRILETQYGPADGGPWAVGDRLAICAVVTSDGGVEAAVRVVFTGAADSAYPAKFTGAVTRGVVYQELVIPSGTTRLDFRLTAGPGTGVVSFGQVTVLNLTELGLA